MYLPEFILVMILVGCQKLLTMTWYVLCCSIISYLCIVLLAVVWLWALFMFPMFLFVLPLFLLFLFPATVKHKHLRTTRIKVTVLHLNISYYLKFAVHCWTIFFLSIFVFIYLSIWLILTEICLLFIMVKRVPMFLVCAM